MDSKITMDIEPIKVVIVEDEPPARMKLEAFVERTPGLLLERSFSDALSALDYLKYPAERLLFLDIQMERFTGVQLMESLVNPPKIVITSAYEAYALKGFEYNVTDYLLKPYSYERFLKAVDKVRQEFVLQRMKNRVEQAYILIKTEYRMEKIAVDSILFIEGMKDYLRIHTPTQRVMTLRSFSAMEQELAEGQFVRLHRSYMVALAHISSVEKDAVTVGGVRIPIGKSYKERFLEILNGNK